MGLTASTIQYIYRNRDRISGKRVGTLGVLYPYIDNRNELKNLKREIPEFDETRADFAKYLFCDLCGAQSCEAIDVSDYQGAEVVINLNLPVETTLHGRFDVLYDAGTFEHLSDLRQAFSNVFDLLDGEGKLFFGQPCNGWVEHGFFQFSPTFFRDLCFANEFLKLDELFLSSGTKQKISLHDVNHQLARAFVFSHKRVNIVGVISKQSNGNLNFNFIQEKYRSWHLSGDDTSRINLLKWLYRKFLATIIESRTIPFRMKKAIFQTLQKIRRKI